MNQTALLLMAFLGLAPVSALAGNFDVDRALAAQDYKTAYGRSLGPAQAGDLDSMLVVGTLLDTGKGVAQDFAAALSWYRRAAEAGSVRAMFNTAAMYDNGRGTRIDRQEAIRWYGLAAASGDSRAAYALGVIYRDGDGVRRDRARAIQAFQQAAAGGLEAARANLAALNAGPPAPAAPKPRPKIMPATAAALNTPPPEIERIQRAVLSRAPIDGSTSSAFGKLLPVLAENTARGDGVGVYNLGYAYQHGIGISKDLVKSYVYYLRAALSSEPTVKSAAMRGASEVGKNLTETEHRTAQAELLEGR